MKRSSDTRYFVTDFVAIPIIRLYKKSDAYRQATGDGWGVVYTDNKGIFVCDEDSSAVLINNAGEQCCIFPYEELAPKKWYKQAECVAIIQTDSGGLSYWEKVSGSVKIHVTRDEGGFIDTYRLVWAGEDLYDGEVEIRFENLPSTDPYCGVRT